MNGKKGHSEQFVKLPHRVIDSPQFLLLSGSALRLLLDLLRQYKGNNNGFLIATEARLMKRGWTSKATIASAIDEVLHSGLVKRLAEGGLNRPARYALAWIELAKAPPPIVLQKARRPRSTKRATPPKNGVVALTPENGVVPVFATPENGVVLPQKVGQPCDTGLRTTPKTGVVDGFCDTRLPQKLGRSISTKGGAVEVGEVGGLRTPPSGALISSLSLYVKQADSGVLSVAIRLGFQTTETRVCESADPAMLEAAAAHAINTARTHGVPYRLVGTTEALAAFDPYLRAAKGAA